MWLFSEQIRFWIRLRWAGMALGLALIAGSLGFIAQLRAQAISPAGEPLRGRMRSPKLTPDQEIARLQAKARQDPQDYQALNELAGAYIHKARASGDFDLYQKAQSAVDKSLALRADNYAALKYQAALHLVRHEFGEALKVSQKTTAAQPADAWNYGTMGDALVELGRYEEAAPVIQKMVAIQPGLSSYSRTSYMRELYGDVPGAIEAMRMAAQAGNPQDAESVAWCWLHVGYLYFNKGNLDQAESHFSHALAVFPKYHYALAGLASVKAARQAYAEAVVLYDKAIAIIPLPEFVSALGDVYLAMGRRKEAQLQFDLVEHMAKLRQAKNEMYDRHLALFYADHGVKLAEALNLAQKEIAVRKDIYGYDALAWALYQNQRYRAALSAMKEALRLGTKDARLFYHAGMIYYRLNDLKMARDYFRRALETNPYFHPTQVSELASLLKTIKSPTTTSPPTKSP